MRKKRSGPVFSNFFLQAKQTFFLLNRLAQSLPQFLMSKDGVLKSEQIHADKI